VEIFAEWWVKREVRNLDLNCRLENLCTDSAVPQRPKHAVRVRTFKDHVTSTFVLLVYRRFGRQTIQPPVNSAAGQFDHKSIRPPGRVRKSRFWPTN